MYYYTPQRISGKHTVAASSVHLCKFCLRKSQQLLVRFQRHFMRRLRGNGRCTYYLQVLIDDFSHSYGPLINITPKYSTYFVYTQILTDHWLDFYETSWELLASIVNAHIACMFWFNNFSNKYGPLMNSA